MRPVPRDAASFRFTHRSVVERSIVLGFALDGATGERITFEETLELPGSLGPLASPSDPAVARALLGLHIAAGTSYWKTSVPRAVAIDDAVVSGEDAAFWTEVYTLGMAEFFYRNGIDPSDAVDFAPGGSPPERVAAPRCDRPPLLLWGGGKDSVVSHEVLALAGEPHDLLTVGRAGWEWICRSASVAGVAHHVVERRLDPKLFELNAAGALNGHVPISAYLAFAGVLIALLTGRRAVIASNESSASEGNTTWHGIDVNHQWSKSLAFERGFRRWMDRNLAGGPEYFSLLRPLTELRIVRAFATHPRFHATVTSCNRNFSQSGPAAQRWCLACPKCVFVSLMARPWLDDAGYHAMFGGDALADPGNVDTIEELLGLSGTKPFECVGTPEESIAAIHVARSSHRAIPHGCMTLFNERVASVRSDLDAAVLRSLARAGDHAMSAPWISVLDAYLDRH